MVHVLAVLGLAALCGLWVVLQRAAGNDDSDGGAGRCGACAEKERCGEETGDSA
jgi:hypothetical protein